MCHPARCQTCGKTTWTGCGRHVADVQALVPASQWCPGHDNPATATRPTPTSARTAGGAASAATESERRTMNLDRAVFALAGTLTLLSALLALVSPWWLVLAAFVGANQLQASITGFCPAASILRRLGVRSGCAFR